MKKEIRLGAKSRKELMKGVNTLYKSVVSTLGPNGRNVIISAPGMIPKSTKDGVTVAKEIVLDDPIENVGASIVKQASVKTSDIAGDGTTTATLLAREMIKEGLDKFDKKNNVVEIKREIDKATKEVISAIKNEISKDVSSEKQFEQVATISANNDPEIGKLIQTAIEKVGIEGVVHIEKSHSGKTYLETVEGLQFERGFKSPYFVTNNDNMTVVLDEPLILLADEKFTHIKDLLPILEHVSTTGKPLIVIAEDIEHEALATLVVNKSRGILKVAAVKAPDFGDRRKMALEDIAILTGGKVFDTTKGMLLSEYQVEWLGEARKITIDKDKTTIVDGKGDSEVILERIESIKKQLDSATTPFDRENLQNRLGKMSGGVCMIHVGGFTETEISEKTDRVDDALNATKAALEAGIVPGGGAALIYAREYIKDKDSIGGSIVYKACGKPFIQILKNAGFDKPVIPAKMLRGKDKWLGLNVKTQKLVNMEDEGIIDPSKVTITALENAASVAGNLLLTECVIVDVPEEGEGAQINPMMGMM